jgi:TPR repeat protein
MGGLFSEGVGVKKSNVKAVEYWKQGCELSDVNSCKNLGMAYLLGKGAPKSDENAMVAWERACDLKDPQSCWNDGNLYHASNLDEKAIAFFHKGCDFQYQRACESLKALQNKGTGPSTGNIK